MNNISSLKKKNDEFNMRIMSMLNEIKTNVSIMVVKVNFVIFQLILNKKKILKVFYVNNKNNFFYTFKVT